MPMPHDILARSRASRIASVEGWFAGGRGGVLIELYAGWARTAPRFPAARQHRRHQRPTQERIGFGWVEAALAGLLATSPSD
jgi:hypothetical protein